MIYSIPYVQTETFDSCTSETDLVVVDADDIYDLSPQDFLILSYTESGVRRRMTGDLM